MGFERIFTTQKVLEEGNLMSVARDTALADPYNARTIRKGF